MVVVVMFAVADTVAASAVARRARAVMMLTMVLLRWVDVVCEKDNRGEIQPYRRIHTPDVVSVLGRYFATIRIHNDVLEASYTV